MAGMKKKMKPKANIDMSNQLLDAAFSDFIREKDADNLVEETLNSYKVSYKKFCEFYEEYQQKENEDDIYTGNIAVGQFTDWKIVMHNEGLAEATINHHLGCMRAFMYWCMADERKYIEPFKIRLIRVQEKMPKDYDLDEIEKLLRKPNNKAKFTEWRSWAASSFVIGTGARIGTLVEIQLKDIDFKERTVRYQHTKNKNLQRANMPPKLVKTLREYINTCFPDDYEPEDYLFCNISGEKLSKASLRAGYVQYTKSRGVPKTNIHGLRHSFAREWYLNGGDLVQLSKILGHSTLAMSEHYMNVYADMAKDRFDQFNPLENIANKGRGKTRRKVKL